MSKKIYMTPQTEMFDTEVNDLLAGSPSAVIEDPKIEGSREFSESEEIYIF